MLKLQLNQQVDENVSSVESVFEMCEQFNKIIQELNARNSLSELHIEQVTNELVQLKKFIKEQLEQHERDR